MARDKSLTPLTPQTFTRTFSNQTGRMFWRSEPSWRARVPLAHWETEPISTVILINHFCHFLDREPPAVGIAADQFLFSASLRLKFDH